MKVLIGCEKSGIVREAFKRRGHDAWSCDIQPTEVPGNHIQRDIFDVLNDGWDLGIFHPECTFLCNSGVRWMSRPGRYEQMRDACDFFMRLYKSPIPKKALENPVMHGHAKKIIGIQQDQVVQPWWFGDPERKATCLWLVGLPKLIPTNRVLPLGNSVHREPPGPNRKANRSRTFPGFAEAMAEQWGGTK